MYDVVMNRLAEITKAIETLRLELPEWGHWLEPGHRLEGLEACHRRVRAWSAVSGEPPLVAALYGPTGAGKSTLFKLLSGINVPSGEQTRPMSRSCALAVPPAWADPAKLAPVFPAAELVPMGDGAALLAPGQPFGRLHAAVAPSLSSLGPGGSSLLLVDAPDYNGVDPENALRAEEILLRAEILVFVLQVDSYLVARNVEELARAARLATRLVVVLTKARDSLQAWMAWDDLCRRLDDPAGLEPMFADRRADGRSCAEVVRSAPVFMWARAERPELAGIMARKGSSLVDRLAGQEARRVAWEGVAGAAHEAATDARRLLTKALEASEAAGKRRASLVADAREAGARVAGREFPFGALMQSLVKEARSALPDWWKIVSMPVDWLFGTVKTVYGKASEWIGQVKEMVVQESAKSENREDVERRVLSREADALLDSWRSRPDLADLGLESSRCASAREALLAAPLPGVSQEWEAALRDEARRWVAENPGLAKGLPVISDVVMAAGFGLLVIDLGFAGGLFGTAVVVGKLGAGGVIAGGAGALGLWGRFLGEANMEQMLRRVDATWRKTRAADLSAHIERHLVGAVAAPLDAVLGRAKPERLAAIGEAVRVLEAAGPGGPMGS